MSDLPDAPALAAQLRSLHRSGDPLVLVNAWDVASAERVVAAGGRAIGTSSAAIAASLGLPDDPTAPVAPLLDVVARIASAVEVPVTADLLDGYGLEPAELVERLVATGAVGCNLEDSDHDHPGELLDVEVAAARLAGVRAAADRAGVEIVINARIDTLFYGDAPGNEDILRRARRYLEAGADCVYPIGLNDPHETRTLVDALDALVNFNLAPGSTVGDLAAAGASRISIGPMAHRATLRALDELAADLLDPKERDR